MRHRGQFSRSERAARSRLAKLVHNQPFLCASLVSLNRVCGKEGCKCSRGELHPGLCIALRVGEKRKMIYVPQPMETTVHEGLIKDIKGGTEAKQFKGWLESLNDQTAYNIAELGVGMNPHIKKFDGSSRDEGVVGGIHIGIGENTCFPGGKVKSAYHNDFVLRNNVTLELDGKAVIKEGKQLI